MDLTDAIGEFEPGVAGQTVRAVRRRMNVEDRMPRHHREPTYVARPAPSR